MVDYERRLPVNLITGFLGSGKTTLLQRLLRAPELGRTAVLVNELGEIGLDHLLLDVLDAETVLLKSGCVCCTIRGDLAEAIRALHGRRARGEIPAFDRLAIETTGLADPAPIVATLTAEPVVAQHFRLSSIVTTVDAVNCAQHLAEHPEAQSQAAVADRLVLTKTDLAAPTAIAAARAALGRLNPAAPVIDAAGTPELPAVLLTGDVYEPASRQAEVGHWLQAGHATHHHHHHHAPADQVVSSFALSFAEPLDWTAFGLWLTMLLHAHGHRVLRVKGILNVKDVATPVVIHGVQRTVHPPAHLERWPDADRRSRLVFITRGLDQAQIKRSLAAVQRAMMVPA